MMHFTSGLGSHLIEILKEKEHTYAMYPLKNISNDLNLDVK